MADLLTVYDDDQANTFIDCMICDKRIRGESQYKVHVTTLQHLKREEALVAQGAIPRQPQLPQWTDIKEYLEYLSLDEPIIGLSSLVQIPDFVSEDGKNVLKYKCRLCVVEMDLYSMVAHIIGRKHRQKYLELKRPDLVTWHDTASAQKQPGLVARAKAAVVEKQEGWGKPEPLRRQQETFRNVHQAGNVSQSSAHGRDPHRQPPLVEDVHRQPYVIEDRPGRPYYAREKYDGPNPGDAVRHQSYPEESRRQRPYEEPGNQGLLRDDYSERELHARPYADQDGGRRPLSQQGYENTNLDRRPFSGGDGHSLVSRDVPRNRHNDKDLRIHSAVQHPGDSQYQEGQMEDRMYSAYGMDATSKHGRSFRVDERRGAVKEFDRTMHGYPQRFESGDDPRSYSDEMIPAKKKRKSRFSDATAEEIAVAHIRHSEDRAGQRSHNQQRDGPIRPLLFNNPLMDSGSAHHFNPNPENVLDVLNDIEIENMDEAKYLKEKLCSVLKEFQAAKASRLGDHTSQSVSDHRGDQHRDAYDNNLRDDSDGIYYENRGFQEGRQYEDSSRNLQEPRQYDNDPGAFREVRQYEDDPGDPRDTRHYEDDSRDYREPRRFDRYPSDSLSKAARHDANDPRGFQKTRLQENTVDFPERRGFENDQRVKAGHYEEYSRASQEGQHHADGLRSNQDARYYDDDFRGSGNWNNQRMRGMESTGTVDDRGFQERVGNPPSHFKPPPLLGETRMYPGRGQHRLHQDGHPPDDELYDPFQPSSSPPPEPSTSLNKIASTLLELVSRR
ncbi:uncharacterized protein si:ch211-13c6.2 isoform X1 [Triplophysa dalaica]|uniref:uncharacterized protein si:ch211-13c6.2 isoform X1 n=2 Tax=Triplophysa dalaica TaxID=1582913 RepID=UPI0024DF8D6E|nr:uncharacterized protein si:ch211-13c6.2 isoform X1 [Triplophysa dalaica]